MKKHSLQHHLHKEKVRSRFFLLPAIVLLLVFVVVPLPSAMAYQITYDAMDLPDVNIGQDLWQYTYQVSNYTFDANHGFTIYFDYNLPFSNIQSPPPVVNSDWDVITWQPDITLPDDGAYDALALTNNASLTDPFTVEFDWAGIGAPGSQFYEIHDEFFQTVGIGDTVDMNQATPVPLPSTLLLLGSGFIGWRATRKKQRT